MRTKEKTQNLNGKKATKILTFPDCPDLSAVIFLYPPELNCSFNNVNRLF